jgi:hypothetical protein
LSLDTFHVSQSYGSTLQRMDAAQPFTGPVTCSVPFSKSGGSSMKQQIDGLGTLGTLDGRELVAIGCQEGVWIGLRSDPRCRSNSTITDYSNVPSAYRSMPASFTKGAAP